MEWGYVCKFSWLAIRRNILLDWMMAFFLQTCDIFNLLPHSSFNTTSYLHLRVCPAWNLYNHMQEILLIVRE